MVRVLRSDSTASTLLFTSVLLLLEWISILWATGGHFSYALDDAYIHLSVARSIAEGHYGLDTSHFSSPSSSIVWPFLLAILAKWQGFEFVPLLLNSLFALGFGVICQRTMEENLGAILPKAGVGSARFLTMVLVLTCNVVPTVFLGLEHSLQLLVSASAVRGFTRYRSRGEPRLSDFVPFFLGPLVRYENLGLALGLVLFLALERRFRSSVSLLVLSIVGPLAFALFLMAHGDPPVPTSIYAKSPLAWTNSWQESFGLVAGRAADALVHSNRGLLLGLCVALEMGLGTTSPSALGKRLMLVPLVPLLLHLFFGDYGRYELYLWAFVLLFAAVQWSEWGRASQANWNRSRAWALSTALLIAGAPYLGRLVQTPFGARSIYYQQGSLAEVSRRLGASVAANDIGLISFRNALPVVDLWGLSSYEILTERKHSDSGWMERVLERHGVQFALIYDAWFLGQVPPTWVKVAELTYPGPLSSTAEGTVACYARGNPAAEKLRATLGAMGSEPGKRELRFFSRESPLH